MSGAIASLARHRLAGRGAAVVLLVVAVAAATGLTATIGALGGAAGDRAIGLRLAALEPTERSARITAYLPTAGDDAERDATARGALALLGSSIEPTRAGAILRRVRDPGAPYDLQLVAVDGVEGVVRLTDGRLPAACDGRDCEALLLSRSPAPPDLPGTLRIAGMTVRVVGRATIRSEIPVGRLDERGPTVPPADPYSQTTDAPPALLLVDGVVATVSSPAASRVGRTVFWTAPLLPARVRPWTVAGIRVAVEDVRRSLEAAPELELAVPLEAIDEELARADANDTRLVLVGSLTVAVLLVFAAFAALLGRRDLRHELERLRAAGAGRRDLAMLVALEVLGPVAVGGLVGLVAAAGLAPLTAPLADGDGALAVARVLDRAVLGPWVLVLLATAAAVLAGLLGGLRRDAVVGLVPGVGLAGALVVAVLAQGPDPLAGGALRPALALVPAGIGLAAAAVAIAIVPSLLRRAALLGGRSRTGPASPVRLALVSLARDAGRPAATLVLLAFGVGGLVFALTDAATLDRGIRESAAFRAGADLRVTEAGTDLVLTGTVAPVERYADLPGGARTWPVVHAEASVAQAPVTVLGLPPDAIPALRAWRADSADRDPAALAAAIAVPGRFGIGGHRLDPAATELVVRVRHAGDTVDLSAVVATDRGDAVRIHLGFVRLADTTLRAPLPPEAVGGRVIALVVGEGRLIAGQDHPARLARATLTIEGFPEVTGEGPFEVVTSGVHLTVIREPLATDGLVLPAIVSPDVAALAARTPGGVLAVAQGEGRLVRITVAAVASRFPSIEREGASFVVLALDPLLEALDGSFPGSGHPDEAWIRVDDPAAVPAVRAALAAAPFRGTSVVDRLALEAAALADPFAGSILAAIVAAGAAGLLLAALGLLLGTLEDLRDESGELRDLEAQGLGPAALRRQVATRSAVLAGAGVLAGLAAGLGLAVVVTGAIGLGADVGRPIPPLAVTVPWGSVGIAFAAPLAVGATAAWIAGRRAFGRSSRSSAPASEGAR